MSDDTSEGDGGLIQIDVDWHALTKSLPCGRDADAEARRRALYAKWDVNANGMLSMSEVDRGMRELMAEQMGDLLDSKLMTWSQSWKPVIMRAYAHAKNSSSKVEGGAPKKSKSKKSNDDYVEMGEEFRLMLLCMRQYFELYVAFTRMDSSMDRRLDMDEFKGALEPLALWGIAMTAAEAEAEFVLIDDNGGGYVLFEEFIQWALQKGLDLDDDDDFDAFVPDEIMKSP